MDAKTKDQVVQIVSGLEEPAKKELAGFLGISDAVEKFDHVAGMKTAAERMAAIASSQGWSFSVSVDDGKYQAGMSGKPDEPGVFSWKDMSVHHRTRHAHAHAAPAQEEPEEGTSGSSG